MQASEGNPMIASLNQSYSKARQAFLRAATKAEARVESYPHPLLGLEGEALFVDVAEVGAPDATSLVIVVSGTHGVEGYLGSAFQRHHLEHLHLETLGEPRENVAFVFVHALNPYGFSWVRRVNEDNVDLNRNFIDWSQPPPQNDDYGQLRDTLVPGSWSDADQARTRIDLISKLTEFGFDRSQQIISGGQYDHPTGLFYGGTEPTWSHRWLRDFIQHRLATIERAAILDIHTGLGPWSHAELISSAQPDSATLERQRSWWDHVTSIHEQSSVSAEIAGEWLGAVEAFAPNTELTGVAIEYGTVDTVLILDSLRADAVLHASGMHTSPDAAAVRAQVRAAFIDDDPAWLQACWAQYAPVFNAATHQLGDT